MTDECYYRVSIKGIAIDETGRFLLAREDNGMWEFLGGGLDHGEDPIICLKREVKEETGLEVTHVSGSPKYFISAERLGHQTFIANVIYEIKLKDLDFTASDECQELRFFTVEEASKEDLFPNVKEFLKIYNPSLHAS